MAKKKTNTHTNTPIGEIKNLKDGKHELIVTIPAKAYQQSYDAYLRQQAKTLDIKGFRKGNVPTSAIGKELGEKALTDVFDKLASYYVVGAINTHSLTPIIPPQIKNLPKIVLGTDVKFTVIIVAVPEFKLVDPKKIKVKKESTQITDKEVNATLEAMWAREKQATKIADSKKDSSSSKTSTNTTKGKNKPELNDLWAKKIAKKYGIENISTLKDLQKMVKTTGEQHKARIIQNKYYAEIMKTAVTLSKIKMPEEAIIHETKQREYSFRQQLVKNKLDFDKYLKDNNTSLEKLNTVWKQDSQVALEEHTILVAFAKQYKITTTGEDFEKFINEAKKSKHFKETPQWRNAMQSVYMKTKAFEKLLKLVEGKK